MCVFCAGVKYESLHSLFHRYIYQELSRLKALGGPVGSSTVTLGVPTTVPYRIRYGHYAKRKAARDERPYRV